MGLISSLSNAISGLNVNQQNLNILSQNIANANTPDYSTQVANQQAAFINGLPQGVTIASITRKVNEFLVAQVRSQTTASSATNITQTYLQQVENLLGQPGGTNSLDQNINTFFTALQNMANTPSISAQTTAVNAAVTLASQMSSLANSTQNLRLQADTEIANSVNAVNADLKKLHSLNGALQHANATNENMSGLLDQRDATLKDLAQYLDIQTLVASDGSVSVNAASGATLVGNNLVQLSYTQASSSQSFVNNGTLNAIQATAYDDSGKVVGKPVTLASSGVSGTNGTDSTITTGLTTGKIGALIQVRDTILPSILGQLDELASTLRDQVNSINNSGTAVPPPTSYTGERLVSANQASQYSGSIRIALLNPDGSPVASSYADEPNGMQPLTLDLSKLDTGSGAGNVTTDGLINAINQYFGQPQAKYETGNLNNVQLALDSDTIPASGNQMTFDFSLNNISKSNASFFVTGVTVTDNTGAVMDSNPTLNVPSIAITNYASEAGSNTLTLTRSGNTTLAAGDMIYIPPANPATTVGGISTGQISGYFKIHDVNGSTFQIDLPTATTAATTDSQAITNTALSTYATAGAGQTVRTSSNGTITASLANNPNASYYTVSANIATIDDNGNVQTSTVTYKVGPSSGGARNDLYSVQTATGNGTIVQPNSGGTTLVASLVDANGKALQMTNGSYGSQQGYLKIASADGTMAVAIDSLDSKQLGVPNSAGLVAGTNRGFSDYFGLNNFFKANQPSATGDTLTNSALNLAVTSRITSNPSLISVGKLVQSSQPADSSQPANYTYRLNSGDNSISQQLAGLANSSVTFDAAGGLARVGTTFSQYSGLIIAQTSANLTNATNANNDSQTLLNGFTSQSQNISGVNLDQELANTVIYQNAYSASTRVITVVSDLFQDLLSILR